VKVSFDGTVYNFDGKCYREVRKTVQGQVNAVTHTNEFWVTVMQRAYLKLRGIPYLNATKISQFFTGEPIHFAAFAFNGAGAANNSVAVDKRHLLPDGVFSAIQHQQGKYAMAAGTFASAEANVIGTRLVYKHAYTVYKATEVNGQKYVYVRNPWGYDGGTGGHDAKPEDGIIVLTWADFKRSFQAFSILYATSRGAFTTNGEDSHPTYPEIRMLYDPFLVASYLRTGRVPTDGLFLIGECRIDYVVRQNSSSTLKGQDFFGTISNGVYNRETGYLLLFFKRNGKPASYMELQWNKARTALTGFTYSTYSNFQTPVADSLVPPNR
jgi:hypothetical protein